MVLMRNYFHLSLHNSVSMFSGWYICSTKLLHLIITNYVTKFIAFASANYNHMLNTIHLERKYAKIYSCPKIFCFTLDKTFVFDLEHLWIQFSLILVILR